MKEILIRRMVLSRIPTVVAVVTALMMTFLVHDVYATGTPVRNGFTLELGLGGGLTFIMPEHGDSESEFGLAGLSLSLGGFINNELSVMFRISGTTFSPYDVTLVNAIGAVAVQYWLTDAFFISAGPAYGIYGVSYLESGDYPDPLTGFALDFRTGYSFANWENHSLRLDLEIMPAFYDEGTVVGTALLLEWQWF